jgi:CheY-like chemotaxis protein
MERAPPVRSDRRPILVVDDDAGIRELLRALLEGEGFEVLCATDGDEALALAAAGPALILLNLRMPRMDARGFAAGYRATPGARAPIILVSGAPELTDEAALLGVDYLAKPFDLEDVLRVIRKNLPSG